MRKLFFIAVIAALFSLEFTACGNPSGDTPVEQKNTVDLNRLPASDSNGTVTFDAATKVITFNGENRFLYLWLDNLEISDYNIVRVKYRALDAYGFIFVTDYDDETLDWEKASTYCPSYLNEMVIPLDSDQKRLKGFSFQSAWSVPYEQFVIEAITLENVENPKLTDVRANDEPPVIDTAASGSFDDSLIAWDFVKNLGVGLQYEILFNSICAADCALDFGTEYYCSLTRQKPTQKEIHFIKEKGFKTLRVQFNPNPHMLDEKYTIDPRFVKMLKDIVGFAIAEDMYVIVCGPANDFMSEEAWVEKVANDIHYAGYTISQETKNESKAFIKAVWEQITAALNNSYDEHLIFETLNEPTDRFHEHTFAEKTDCAVCLKDFALMNEYNQMIVDIIRASGGNNAKRFIMVEGLGGGWRNITTELFELPQDTIQNRLMPSLHNYVMGCPPWHRNYYTEYIKKHNIEDCFEALDEVYFSKQIPVYISETGHGNKAQPLIEAINCMKDFMAEVIKPGRSCAVLMHDSGNNETFNFYDKWKLEWYDTEYIDTILYAAEGKEFPLTQEYIKKHEVKIESIVGKEFLPAPVVIKDWDNNYAFSAERLIRSTPSEYKFVFEIETTGSDPQLEFAYIDSNSDFHNGQNTDFLKNLEVEGGTVNGSISVESDTVKISISEDFAKELEGASDILIQGYNITIKSMKVVE